MKAIVYTKYGTPDDLKLKEIFALDRVQISPTHAPLLVFFTNKPARLDERMKKNPSILVTLNCVVNFLER